VLFEGSLNIDIRSFIKSIPHGMKLTVLNFIASLLVGMLGGYLLGLELGSGLLLGAILGGTSSAIVIPILKRVNVETKTGLSLMLESAISDVITIVGALTIAKVISLSQFDVSEILNKVLTSFIIAIAIGSALGFFWAKILQKFESLNSYMITIAFLLMVYSFTEFIGSSGPIASLMFGLVLGNSRKLFVMLKNREERNILTMSARNFYAEISFFVKTFFFVYVGIMIDFSEPIVFLYSFLFIVGLYLLRTLVVKIAIGKEDVKPKDRAIMEVMIPKGLAAAVLATIAHQFSIPGADLIKNIVLASIFISIVMASAFVFMVEKMGFKGISPLFSGRHRAAPAAAPAAKPRSESESHSPAGEKK
jgi:cell volume regulation protein A